MAKDLTKGKPFKQIILFSLPVLLGGIFQQLYGLADTLIVGQTINFDAVGALGATGAISFLLQGFAMGMTSGFSVYTAQKYGAGESDKVRRSIAASILFSAIMSVVLTIISAPLAAPILRLMGVPAEIFQMSWEYLFVTFLGFTSIVFYNMFAQLLRALGDSRTPLYFLILTCALNVGLDFAFILGADMGVIGAALATVISQTVSVVLCMIYAFVRYPEFRISKEQWKINWRFWWEHLRIGIPMAFMFSITAIGAIINQAALNTLGSTAIATYAAASKVEQFLSQMFVAVGFAAATFTAQNYGAGHMQRIKTGIWATVIIEVVLSVISCVLVIFAGDFFVRFFVSGDSNVVAPEQLDEILKLSRIFFLTNGPAYLALALLFVFRNALQGMGNSIATVYGGIAELVMRSVAAFVLVGYFGFQGVCIANPAAWVGAMVVQVALFLHYFKKINKKSQNKVRSETGIETSIADAPMLNVEPIVATPSLEVFPNEAPNLAHDATIRDMRSLPQDADVDSAGIQLDDPSEHINHFDEREGHSEEHKE